MVLEVSKFTQKFTSMVIIKKMLEEIELVINWFMMFFGFSF